MLGRVKATRVPRASLRLDLDPPCARRLTRERRDAGRPVFSKSAGLRRVELGADARKEQCALFPLP